MEIHATTLSVRRPFSLKATVLSHGWHECSPMSWSEGGQCFQIIERDGNNACRVSVVEKRRTSRSVSLRVTIEGPEITPDFVGAVCHRLGVCLGLDRDITPFHDLCKNDPVLHVIPKIGAGRGIRSASMTENIIKAICGTNVTWNQAVKMINRIAKGQGQPRDLEAILNTATAMEGRTICVFADAAAWPVQSYIQKFRSEFEHHIKTGKCDLLEELEVSVMKTGVRDKG